MESTQTAASQKPRAPGIALSEIAEENRVPLYALKGVEKSDPRSPDSMTKALAEMNIPSFYDKEAGYRIVDKTKAPAEFLAMYASDEMKQAREAEKAADVGAKKETARQARPAAKAQGREPAVEVPYANRSQVFTVGGRENKDSPYLLGKLNKELKDAGVKQGVLYDKENRVYYVDNRDPKQVELAAPYRTPEAEKANAEFVKALDAAKAEKGQTVADKATMEAGEKAGTKGKTRSVQPSLLADPKVDRAMYETGMKAISNLAKMAGRAGDVIRMTASEAVRMQVLVSTSGTPTTETAKEKLANTQGRYEALERGFRALTQAYAKEHGIDALNAEMAKGRASSNRLPEGIKAALVAAGRSNNTKEAATR